MKSLFKVGINDVDHPTEQRVKGVLVRNPYYTRWFGMLARCYSPATSANQPEYDGCEVDERWLKFSNFKAWMEKQEWEGRCLDKDLIVFDNKIYGPDTCLFISEKLNKALMGFSGRNTTPKGFSKDKNSNKYRARVSIDGTLVSLGQFHTELEACEVYFKAKFDYLVKLAHEEGDELTRNLVLIRIQKLKEI